MLLKESRTSVHISVWCLDPEMSYFIWQSFLPTFSWNCALAKCEHVAHRQAATSSNHYSNTSEPHHYGFGIKSVICHFHLLAAHSPPGQTSDSPWTSAQTFSSDSSLPPFFASQYSPAASSRHSSWISCLAVLWSSQYRSIRSFWCTTQRASITFSAFSASHVLCPWIRGGGAVSARISCVNQLRKWSWKSPRGLLWCS